MTYNFPTFFSLKESIFNPNSNVEMNLKVSPSHDLQPAKMRPHSQEVLLSLRKKIRQNVGLMSFILSSCQIYNDC